MIQHGIRKISTVDFSENAACAVDGLCFLSDWFTAVVYACFLTGHGPWVLFYHYTNGKILCVFLLMGHGP